MRVLLRVVEGPASGRVLEVAGGDTLIVGLDAAGTPGLDDPLLARHHCALASRGDDVIIVDLASDGGTFVNDVRILGATPLRPGDHVKIGSTVLEALAAPVHAAPHEHPVPSFVLPPTRSFDPAAVATPPAPPDEDKVERTLVLDRASPVGEAGERTMVLDGLPAFPPIDARLVPASPPEAHRTTRLGDAPDFGEIVPEPDPTPRCAECKAALVPGKSRSFQGRTLCLRCHARFDVKRDLIPGFKIVERVQVTESGPVYRAEQDVLNRTVLLKTLVQGGWGAEAKAAHRFLREAKLGGRLDHPGIVEIYDVNEEDGVTFIVLEYVPGRTLDQILAEGKLPLPRALRYLAQAAEALHYAHEQGVVHRDVRPAALHVRAGDDRLKVGDFSLAKRAQTETISIVTNELEAIGAPLYVSPEQLRDVHEADARSDQYSLAATFFHAISGSLPYAADPSGPYEAFADELLSDRPARTLSSVLPGVPPALDALFARALEKDPARRYPDLGALLADLAPIRAALGD